MAVVLAQTSRWELLGFDPLQEPFELFFIAFPREMGRKHQLSPTWTELHLGTLNHQQRCV